MVWAWPVGVASVLDVLVKKLEPMSEAPHEHVHRIRNHVNHYTSVGGRGAHNLYQGHINLFLIPAHIDILRLHQQNILLSQPFIVSWTPV